MVYTPPKIVYHIENTACHILDGLVGNMPQIVSYIVDGTPYILYHVADHKHHSIYQLII